MKLLEKDLGWLYFCDIVNVRFTFRVMAFLLFVLTVSSTDLQFPLTLLSKPIFVICGANLAA